MFIQIQILEQSSDELSTDVSVADTMSTKGVVTKQYLTDRTPRFFKILVPLAI